LDLPTHFTFGLAIGLVFFGRLEIAMVVGLGALLPDLDREYWYIPAKRYAEEQRHRALFHNVIVIAVAYLVSPFLSLGVFLHVLQDSFTTVKDRGVEWFYPFTRLVKRGAHDTYGSPQPPVPGEQVYFYQEDPPGLVKLADNDLQEPDPHPVPWRRVYGFAQNSHLLDKGFLFGSIALAILWLLNPVNSSIVASFSASIKVQWGIGVGYLALAVLFISGETQSSVERERAKMGLESKPDPMARLRALKPVQLPLLIMGFALLALSIAVTSSTIIGNIETSLSDLPFLFAAIATVLLVGLFVVKWQIRGGRTTVV
jgi:LexA-binding, inner membrane-associated putative hydrolase